jgi:hypothetical protein
MPALDDFESTRDFIACTAYGMLTEKNMNQNGTQLLYAAQVALSLLRYQPPKDQKPKKKRQIAA